MINPRYQLAHFFNRLAATYHLKTNGDTLTINGLFNGQMRQFSALSNTLYQQDNAPAIKLSLNTDPSVGEVINVDTQTLRATSHFAVFGQLLVFVIWLVLALISLFILVIAAIRKAQHKSPSAFANKWTLSCHLSSLFGVLFFLIFAVGMQDLNHRFGSINSLTVSLMLMSIAFVIVAILSNLFALKQITHTKGKLNKIFYSGITLLSSLVAVYFLLFDMFAIRPWA